MKMDLHDSLGNLKTSYSSLLHTNPGRRQSISTCFSLHAVRALKINLIQAPSLHQEDRSRQFSQYIFQRDLAKQL